MDSGSHTFGGGEAQKSFRNKFWQIPGHGLLSLREQIIKSRSIEDIETFCDPKIRNSMPNPDGLHQIDLLIDTVRSAKKVGIFGDYDVDGITSSAMWKKFLDKVGIPNAVYIPNRQDGYGASQVGIDYLLKQNVDCILFLDCGSSSKELLEEIPVKVCILDHHQASDPPKVAAVVNPHVIHFPHEEIYKTLCTAGLAFLVLAKFARQVDQTAFCMSLLDLSAIGTLGDMMPLNTFNRACVKRGMELINSSSNLGINTLIDELGLTKPVNSSSLAFYVIPCLNAAGRISRAELSLDLVMSRNIQECSTLAKTLRTLNEQRKQIEEEMVQQALCTVDPTKNVIVLKDPTWHPGVVGIIASRIKEIYNKTCFVLYKSEETWKGSARGYNCNVGKTIRNSVEEGLAIQGGGHVAAGGVTVSADKIDEWTNWVNQNYVADGNNEDIVEVDAVLEESQLSQVFSLKEFGPFGPGNPSPKVVLKHIWLKDIFEGKNYVRCSSHSGLSFMGFRFSHEMLQNLRNSRGKYLDFLISVDESGSTRIEDIRNGSV